MVQILVQIQATASCHLNPCREISREILGGMRQGGSATVVGAVRCDAMPHASSIVMPHSSSQGCCTWAPRNLWQCGNAGIVLVRGSASVRAWSVIQHFLWLGEDVG